MKKAEVTPSDIRNRILNLLGNIFKLTLILLFLRIISQFLNPYFSLTIADFTITEEMVLNTLSFVFIIYYGYGILTNGSFLLDITSKVMLLKLGAKETKKTKAIAYDVTFLVALILAAEAVIPIMGSIPESGSIFVRVTSVIFMGVGFLIIYHLAKGTYSLAKNRIDQWIKRISEMLEVATKKEKTSVKMT